MAEVLAAANLADGLHNGAETEWGDYWLRLQIVQGLDRKDETNIFAGTQSSQSGYDQQQEMRHIFTWQNCPLTY